MIPGRGGTELKLTVLDRFVAVGMVNFATVDLSNHSNHANAVFGTEFWALAVHQQVPALGSKRTVMQSSNGGIEGLRLS